MNVHPAAALLPLMTEDELAALATDIAENGQRETVKLYRGEILDGRNRVRACEIIEIAPRTEEIDIDDPIAYVLSLNIVRRNLGHSQRAIVAAEAWSMYEVPQGKPESGKTSPTFERTRVKLAKTFGVNEKAIQQARALLEHVPELAADVKSGQARLDSAYEALMLRDAESERLRNEVAVREQELERVRAALAVPAGLAPLPPPDPDELATAMNAADALKRLVPQQGQLGHEAHADLTVWENTLEAASKATEGIRLLPDFPETHPDADILRLSAFSVARLLGDACARLTTVVKQTTPTLRSVK